jgi:hypothetical protein
VKRRKKLDRQPPSGYPYSALLPALAAEFLRGNAEKRMF